jgi:hypothetical protein
MSIDVKWSINKVDRIGDVIVSVLTLSAADRVFETQSGQTKYYKIDTSDYPLRSKNKDGLARKQVNVSEWIDISTSGLLFKWFVLSVLV